MAACLSLALANGLLPGGNETGSMGEMGGKADLDFG